MQKCNNSQQICDFAQVVHCAQKNGVGFVIVYNAPIFENEKSRNCNVFGKNCNGQMISFAV